MDNMERMILMLLAGAALYILGAAGTRAGELLRSLLRKKKAEAEAADKKVQALGWEIALGVLDTVTRTVVSNIEHTKAYHIREAVHSGEAAAEELTSLSEEAYYDIVDQLKEPVKEVLDSYVEDTEKLILEKIEEVLPEIKARYRKYKEVGADADAEDGQ